ncbi:MAG TPA: hypothetical protein VE591_00920 [Candidatus Acidoferrum sp.]|nr:hypothetical protein [Candidatus Acidoferrum sp.]
MIAHLLAANCYPAGTTAYPPAGDKAHAALKITTQGSGQLCEVKEGAEAGGRGDAAAPLSSPRDFHPSLCPGIVIYSLAL